MSIQLLPNQGFKGFARLNDIILYCKSAKFDLSDLDKQYSETNCIIKEKGFHYGKTIEEVDKWYSISDPKTVVCIIEDTGTRGQRENDLCVTNSFKIVRVLSRKEIVEHLKLKEKFINKSFEIFDLISEIFPQAILSGSASLVMQGLLNEEKINNDCYQFHDLDVAMPYYVCPEEVITKIENKLEERRKTLNSSILNKSYYDCISESLTVSLSNKEAFCINIGSIGIDFYFNPNITYFLKNHNGKQYKLSNPNSIIKAKVDYVLNGKGPSSKKHAKHLSEIFKNLGK